VLTAYTVLAVYTVLTVYTVLAVYTVLTVYTVLAVYTVLTVYTVLAVYTVLTVYTVLAQLFSEWNKAVLAVPLVLSLHMFLSLYIHHRSSTATNSGDSRQLLLLL